MTAGEILCEDFDRPPLHPSQLESDGLKQSNETPVEGGGSFLVDLSGKCPVDERTGLPLPIAPLYDIDALPSESVNEHHHFYPRLSPILHTTLGGRALRVARIQRVGIDQHNYGDRPFHKYFPEGPEIPTEPMAQLGLCVLSCAGYLPEQVVDTSSGEPVVRPMKEWELNRLSRPASYVEPLPYQVKRYRDRRHPDLALIDAKAELISSRQKQAELTYRHLVYGFDPMKKFMLEMVLTQDYSEVDRSLKQDFLEKDDVQAGLCLLAIGSLFASENATIKDRNLLEVYQELRSEGRMHKLMPPSPATLIKNKLGHISARVEILPVLRAELERQREQSVA